MQNQLTFEQKLEEIENIVKQLENGGMSLEESLKAYERARLLSKELEATLDEAEKRICAISAEGVQTEIDA